MKTRITRRTRLGYGYTGFVDETVERPDHVGTIRQIQDALRHDRTYQSFLSGGTYIREQWFVRLGGQWRRIHPDYYSDIHYLAHTGADADIELI